MLTMIVVKNALTYIVSPKSKSPVRRQRTLHLFFALSVPKSSSVSPVDDGDGVLFAVSEQRRELMEAKSLESDMDLAFNIQLQEALAASLALQPTSSSTQPPGNDAFPTIPNTPTHVSLKSEELIRMEQELKDPEIEIRKAKEGRNHDDRVAREIMKIPEDEWQESGALFAKPFDEGSSSSSSTKRVESESVFRLYFKGLVSEEMVGNQRVVLAGVGVALCDSRDNLVLEVWKPLIGNGMSKNGAQLKALIEGLNAALALDLKRITFFCENFPIFQFVTGKWQAKQHKIAVLVNQVKSLQGKFTLCNPRLLPRNHIKFAFKLARDAIVSQSQTNQPAQSTTCKNVNETCVICLEDTDVSQMFSVGGCLHRYCFCCMKQHVEVKLLHGMIPRCPHEGCKSDLSVDSCAKFLTPKLVETMRQRIKEASIPAAEKVYCPYPRCSALISKRELLEHSKKTLGDVELSGIRKCMKCNCLFCINCKVPWHKNRTCSDYKKLNPYPPEEDTKLKSLASRNLWRQCVKCNHMIELAEGCYHMTCRCGYEFCYNCGAEWKDKKATCACPLWDEGNILYDEDEDEDSEDVTESDSEEYSDYEYSLPSVAPEFFREWNVEKATCSCPTSDEDDLLSNEDGDFEEEEKDENEEEDEYEDEDEDEDEVEDEFEEEKQILSAEDDGDFDEEYEEVQEKEVGEDIQDEEEVEVGEECEHNLSAEDDGDLDEEYEYGEYVEEFCDSDCECYDSYSDY